MAERILCVDDEQNVLDGYRRQLRKKFDIDIALSGAEGLQSIRTKGPYAVIVADMRMPEMDGVQFLSKVKKIAPNTVRMMLTGNADQNTAVEAVNEGHIFRFLNKPCEPDTLAKALAAGIEQHRLITAEKELLEKTLIGSLKVLTEVLSLVNPTAYGRASRVQRLVRQLAAEMKISLTWQLKAASILSQVGCVTVPETTLTKAYQGESLSREEEQMLQDYPRVGSELVAHIPRLEAVSQIIAQQEKKFGVVDPLMPAIAEEPIPPESRILKVALDYDLLESKGTNKVLALAELKGRSGWYDPEVLDALEAIIRQEEHFEIRKVGLKDLTDQMILVDDVHSTTGALLASRGQETTQPLRYRLKNFAKKTPIAEPIAVLIQPKEA